MLDLLAASADVQNIPPPDWAVAIAIGLLVTVVTAPLIVLNVLGARRARRLVDEWARANGIALASVQEASGLYQRGPFGTSSRAASVFQIATKANPVRTGFLNLNNTFLWGFRP